MQQICNKIATQWCNILQNNAEIASNVRFHITELRDAFLEIRKRLFYVIVVNLKGECVCADSVLIPVQAAYLPVKGLQQLIKTIIKVKKQLNPSLVIEGILLTMVDGRTNYASDTDNCYIECSECGIRFGYEDLLFRSRDYYECINQLHRSCDSMGAMAESGHIYCDSNSGNVGNINICIFGCTGRECTIIFD